MIAGTLLLLAMQASAWNVVPRNPTVGDTVRITRRVPVTGAVNAQLAASAPDERMVILADPVVAYSEGAVLVRLTVALFETGELELALPDLELLYDDGRAERVTAGTVRVDVSSILPEDEDQAVPQPSLGPLMRHTSRPELPLALGGLAALGVLVWGAYRRRRTRRPPWGTPTEAVAVPPVDQWMIAGESKAVVTAISDQLRAVIEDLVPEARSQLSTDECIAVLESERPEWPIVDLTDLLRSLDRSRFAPAVPSDVVELVERTEALVVALRTPVEESSA